jgi:hypothetical protein
MLQLTVGQSVCLGVKFILALVTDIIFCLKEEVKVLVSGAHLGPVTNFPFSLRFLLESYCLLFCGALFDESTGL